MTESNGGEDYLGGQEGADRFFGKKPEGESSATKGEVVVSGSSQSQRQPRIESQSTKDGQSIAPAVQGRNALESVSTPESQEESSNLVDTLQAAVVVAGAKLGEKLIDKGAQYLKSRVNEAAGRKTPRTKTTQPEDKRNQETIQYFDDQKEEYEKRLGSKTFVEIQNELKRQLSVAPTTVDGKRIQAENIEKLQFERARLINAADSENLDIFDKLKRQFLNIQASEKSFPNAIKKIASINVKPIETAAKAEFYWSEKFVGMLEEYRDVAVLNTNLALMKAQGDGDSSAAKKLEREIAIRGWGFPPNEINSLAEAYVEGLAVTPKSAGGGGNEINELLRQQLEETRRSREAAERNYIPPAKQREILLNIEESGEQVVEIPPLTSTVWEGLTPEQKKFWHARLMLSNARAKKQIAGLETFTDNPEMMSLTKEALEMLTNSKGTAEAISLYTLFIVEPEFSEEIKDELGMTTTRLFTVDKPNRSFINNKITRVTGKIKYDKLSGVSDLSQLRTFRGQLREYLSDRFSITAEEARTAEQIAYNFIFMTNLAEEVDLSGDPRLRSVINEGLRDMMHPRYKMIDAIATGDRWPQNILGQWAMNNRKRLLAYPNEIPLTENLFPSFLGWTNAQGPGSDKARGGTLKEYLVREGKKLVTGETDSTKIDWLSGKIEQPFGRYMAVQLGRGSMVYGTLLAGEPPRGKTGESLQNAFRSLKTVNKKMRWAILYLMENRERNFIDARKRNFKPNKNRFYMIGFNSTVRQKYPGFFK